MPFDFQVSYIALFFAGAFLCNCLPHLVAGLQGMPFPTPFATPRGIGNSSPLVNFLWGAFNFVAGAYLLSLYPVTIGPTVECTIVAVGALALGLYLSVHFGCVRRGG